MFVGIIFLCYFAFIAKSDPNTILGVWHCGNDECAWLSTPPLEDSDWILDRGDGNPTVNLVTLTFVNPQIMQVTVAMSKFIRHFQYAGLDVMLSLGGPWINPGVWEFLLKNPVAFADNVTKIALSFNVGMEIDYRGKNVHAFAAFVREYRKKIPYNEDNANRLTMRIGNEALDLANASISWANEGLINWVSADAPPHPYPSTDAAKNMWNDLLSGGPHLPSISPNKLICAMWLQNSNNCENRDETFFGQVMGWLQDRHVRGSFFWASGKEAISSSYIDQCDGLKLASKHYIRHI